MTADEKPEDFDPVTWRASKPDDHPDAEVIQWQAPNPDAPTVDMPDEPATIYGTVMRAQNAKRRPIVPAWARSKDERRQVARGAATAAGHTVIYHVTRTPKYVFRSTYRAPVGAGRVVRRVAGWVFDREAAPVRGAAIRAEDSKEYRALEKMRNDRVKLRLIVVAIVLVPLAVAAVAVHTKAPGWVQYAVATIAGFGLAWYGSPAGKPLTDRVTQGAHFIQLTAEMTRNAIVACGVGVKDGAELQFPRDIFRDPPGQTAIVNLPPGVIAMDVVDKREQLAGALRLPKQQVWPAHVRGEHPGMLEIWVAEKPVNLLKPPAWPLLKSGQADYFKPIPFGNNERLRRVDWMLAEKSSLFAGVPGAGKSLAARVVTLGAALDPLVDFVIYDLKGLGDFDPLEPLCLDGMYGSGPDYDTKVAALEALRWLHAECVRRAPLVKAWVRRGVNNENKVNRAMAERDPRLRPIVAMFDEIQELITDPEMGKEAKGLLTSIIKLARAMGIHIALATQRLDKQSLPVMITGNITIRFCMSVPSHVETNLVLGTGMYARGARPTEFQPGRPEDGFDSGWGYRAGYGQMGIAYASLITNEQAHAIVRRAVVLREGLARRGEREKVPSRNVLADVRSVLMPGEEALWSEVLIERLIELVPHVYAGLTVESFGAMMSAAGYRTVSIHRKVEGVGKTKYGVKRNELEAVIAAKAVES